MVVPRRDDRRHEASSGAGPARAGLSSRAIVRRTGFPGQACVESQRRLPWPKPMRRSGFAWFAVRDGRARSRAFASHPRDPQGDADLLSVEILRRVRELGYEGGKSALYDFVASCARRAAQPLVRFEGLCGEFSQHDFGSVAVALRRRHEELIHFFASRLKYSRFAHVRSSRTSASSRWCAPARVLRDLRRRAAGGGVRQPEDGGDQAPRDPDPVERHVRPGGARLRLRRRAVHAATARRRRARSRTWSGWSRAASSRCAASTTARTSSASCSSGSPRSTRRGRAGRRASCRRCGSRRSAQRLRPLPITPAEYALRFPVFVGPTGLVELQGYRYSMPPEAIGIPGTLWLYPERVRIVAGRHERSTRACRRSGRFLHRGRPRGLATVSGDRARLYPKRQQLLDLGADAEAFLTEIVHRHPRTWRGDVEALARAAGVGRAARGSGGARQGRRREKLFGAQHVRALLKETA